MIKQTSLVTTVQKQCGQFQYRQHIARKRNLPNVVSGVVVSPTCRSGKDTRQRATQLRRHSSNNLSAHHFCRLVSVGKRLELPHRVLGPCEIPPTDEDDADE